MREKTLYSEKPKEIDFFRVEEKVFIFFRENIEIDKSAEDNIQYIADEYKLEIPFSFGIIERIENNRDAWIKKAKEDDERKHAKEIREKRNRLLDESDKEMVLDRLGVERPTGSSFGDWLAFLQRISSVMFGEMAKYRQELRDITKQEGFPYDVKFPEKPKTK